MLKISTILFGPAKLVIKIVTWFLTAVVVYYAICFAQVYLTSRESTTQNTTAIVVFGTTEDNGVPSPTLAARLNQAVILWENHRAPLVVVTGGKQPADVYSEAQVSATYLEQHGVPRSKIIVGSGSDTWQNVASVEAAMKAAGITTVMCVTDGFHEYRAMAILSNQGFTPLPSPSTTSPITGGAVWNQMFVEAGEVAVGRIIGYHTLSQITAGAATVTSLPSKG